MALYKEYEKIPKKDKAKHPPFIHSKRHMPLYELDIANIPLRLP
jgi:hypothetical protein